ncbi:MAG: hypothetical protein ACPLQP_11510, partial [Moorellaceae bacterium]
QAVSKVQEHQVLARTAMQQRKVLDSLKARQQAAYIYMAAREEQKHLDDVAAVRYNHKADEPLTQERR